MTLREVESNTEYTMHYSVDTRPSTATTSSLHPFISRVLVITFCTDTVQYWNSVLYGPTHPHHHACAHAGAPTPPPADLYRRIGTPRRRVAVRYPVGQKNRILASTRTQSVNQVSGRKSSTLATGSSRRPDTQVPPEGLPSGSGAKNSYLLYRIMYSFKYEFNLWNYRFVDTISPRSARK